MCAFLLLVGMLQVDPTRRPTINDVIDRLQEIAAARDIGLKSPLQIKLPDQDTNCKHFLCINISMAGTAVTVTRILFLLHLSQEYKKASSSNSLSSK